jgi:hypothetical protein
MLFRLFIASLVFVLFYWLYAHVLPPFPAAVVGGVLAIAEVFAPMLTGSGSHGGSLRLMLALGAPALAWPLAVIGLGVLHSPLTHTDLVSLGAIAAAATGLAATAHGSGRDTPRLTAVLVGACIAVYALAAALFAPSYDPLAIGLGATAVAAAALTARVVVVLPQSHKAALDSAVAIALVCACASTLPALLMHTL